LGRRRAGRRFVGTGVVYSAAPAEGVEADRAYATRALNSWHAVRRRGGDFTAAATQVRFRGKITARRIPRRTPVIGVDENRMVHPAAAGMLDGLLVAGHGRKPPTAERRPKATI
jgi:hypothetical protein